MKVRVATGTVPAQPRLADDDLLIAITHNRGHVLLEFGQAREGVTSYVLDPASSLTFAIALKQHAELAEEQRKAGAA